MAISPLKGIHHVTMISGDAQANVDFYVGILGLRLVKRTVNFDDPGTYHLYYGNPSGEPGTLLTFFPHPGARAGRLGYGQTSAIGLEVPEGAIEAWMELFASQAVPFELPVMRFGKRALQFRDPDGLNLELIETPEARTLAFYEAGDRSSDMAIRGIHSVTLLEADEAPTARFLTETLGFEMLLEEEGRTRFAIGDGNFRRVDVVRGGETSGRGARGSVHHVAFRVETEIAHRQWHQRVSESIGISPIMDRDYFRSVYFHEPGGVLFELATDEPGMMIDEPLESLGQAIRLPAWLGAKQDVIQARLAPLCDPSMRVSR